MSSGRGKGSGKGSGKGTGRGKAAEHYHNSEDRARALEAEAQRLGAQGKSRDAASAFAQAASLYEETRQGRVNEARRVHGNSFGDSGHFNYKQGIKQNREQARANAEAYSELSRGAVNASGQAPSAATYSGAATNAWKSGGPSLAQRIGPKPGFSASADDFPALGGTPGVGGGASSSGPSRSSTGTSTNTAWGKRK